MKTPLGHKLLIAFYLLLAAPLALAAFIFVAVNLLDEPLDPWYAAFYHDDPAVPDDKNAFVALCGITAPRGVDMVKYAQAQMRKEDTASLGKPLPFPDGDRVIPCMARQPQTAGGASGCATPQRVQQLYDGNPLLMKRYRDIRRYPRYTSLGMTGCNGVWHMILNKIYVGHLALLLDTGKPENVYAEWRDDVAFWKRAYNDRQSFVLEALHSVILMSDMRFLPVMLQKYPELARAHLAEIEQLLEFGPFGRGGGWDVAATMRLDAKVYDPLFNIGGLEVRALTFFFQPNATHNLELRMAKDFVALSETPLQEFDKADAAMVAKYRNEDRGLATLYNIAGKSAVRQSLLAHELVKSETRHYAFRKMLQLYTLARAKNISRAEMPAFITAQGRSFWNPLLQKPFFWDADKGRLWMDAPEMQVKLEIYY